MTDHRPTQDFGGALVGAALITLIFLFVWPGPLRYEYRNLPKPNIMIKIDKLNGNTWALENGKYDNKVLGFAPDGAFIESKPNKKR